MFHGIPCFLNGKIIFCYFLLITSLWIIRNIRYDFLGAKVIVVKSEIILEGYFYIRTVGNGKTFLLSNI